MSAIDDQLEPVLRHALPDFRKLVRVRRLSAGASQETYRVEIETAGGERTLALRRAAGEPPCDAGGLPPGPRGELEVALPRKFLFSCIILCFLIFLLIFCTSDCRSNSWKKLVCRKRFELPHPRLE